MKISEIKKIVDKNKWYRQAANSKVYFLFAPALGVHKRINSKLAFFSVKKKFYFEAFYIDQEIKNIAQNIIEYQKKDEKFIDGIIKKCKKEWMRMNEFFNMLESKNIINLELKEVVKLLNALDQLCIDFWYHNFVCDFFDPHGEELLHKELVDVVFKENELNILLKHNTLSYAEQERLELLKLSKKIDQKLLNEHAKKYFYINNSWESTKKLSKKDFLKKIKNLQDVDQQIKELSKNYKSKQEKISKKLNSKQIAVVKLYRELFLLRDERKKYTQLCNFYYDTLFSRIASVTKIPFSLFQLVIPDDLNNNFNREKLSKIIKKREKVFLWYTMGQNGDKLEGNEAVDVYSSIYAKFKEKDFLKGKTACKGKAKGIVKIIMGETHFGKFSDGDILVAPMTRPEYVPLMKKARGIITDEGGITSHAAIVSRELKIPCITGTQIATKILKDSDLVEFNTDKGIIKILK